MIRMALGHDFVSDCPRGTIRKAATMRARLENRDGPSSWKKHLPRRSRRRLHHSPILESDDPVRIFGDRGIMGDHDDGQARIVPLLE